MAVSDDAEVLRNLWGSESIMRYNGNWIAFRQGEVISYAASFEEVSHNFIDEIRSDRGPLFAFVTSNVLI